MAAFTADFKEFSAFFQRMSKAARGEFKRDLTLFLEALGMEFLRVLQDEIIRLKVMTPDQTLLTSFTAGTGENVWVMSEGELTLEVGTNVKYASFVNDGHWTVKEDTRGAFTLKDGALARFVPGRWDGKYFIYDPASDSGMVLKQKWVEGKHYWESALRILDKIYPELLDKKLQQWLDQYFADFI